VGAHTRLCCSARAGIVVASHDLLWKTTPLHYLLMSLSLVIIPYVQSKDLYQTYVIGPPSEVAKKITFEEKVTDINLNRLQGVVDKRLYLLPI